MKPLDADNREWIATEKWFLMWSTMWAAVGRSHFYSVMMLELTSPDPANRAAASHILGQCLGALVTEAQARGRR